VIDDSLIDNLEEEKYKQNEDLMEKLDGTHERFLDKLPVFRLPASLIC
jgi:hypothetical protein